MRHAAFARLLESCIGAVLIVALVALTLRTVGPRLSATMAHLSDPFAQIK